MKIGNLLVLIIAVLLIAGVTALAGCGGGTDQKKDLNDVLVQEGDSFTFEGNQGDLVVFSRDGSFRSVIGGVVEDGTYEIFEGADAVRVELTFENKVGDFAGVETWEITEGADGSALITDPRDEQYVLKGTQRGLRRS
jgi:hypothetical protein